MPCRLPRWFLFFTSSLILLAACRPRTEVREWKASDHDQGGDETLGAMRTPQAPSSANVEQGAMLVDVAWQRNCAPCHGLSGQGDGPSGPMVHAPDLTRADWQGSVTDEQIAKVIEEGKNRMPKFELPPQMVSGLVHWVRQHRAAR